MPSKLTSKTIAFIYLRIPGVLQVYFLILLNPHHYLSKLYADDVSDQRVYYQYFELLV
jgi:hypothetical protein